MKKIFLALLTLCVILPACGGDDGGSVNSVNDSSSSSGSGSSSSSSSASSSAPEQASDPSGGEKALADAIAASISSDPEFPFPDDAACIAESAVGEIGLDRLVELGVTAESVQDPLEDQAPETQEAFINAVLDCVGTSGLANLIIALSDDGDGLPLAVEDAECLAEGLDREQWFSFLQGAFSGELDESGGGEFFAGLLKECPQILVNQIKGDLGLDQAQAECLAGALTDTLIDAFASGDLEGDAPPEVFEELINAFIGCGIDLSQLE